MFGSPTFLTSHPCRIVLYITCYHFRVSCFPFFYVYVMGFTAQSRMHSSTDCVSPGTVSIRPSLPATTYLGFHVFPVLALDTRSRTHGLGHAVSDTRSRTHGLWLKIRTYCLGPMVSDSRSRTHGLGLMVSDPRSRTLGLRLVIC